MSISRGDVCGEIFGKNAPLLSQIMQGEEGRHLASLNITFNFQFTITGLVTLSFLRFPISIGYFILKCIFSNRRIGIFNNQLGIFINKNALYNSRGGSFTKKQFFSGFEPYLRTPMVPPTQKNPARALPPNSNTGAPSVFFRGRGGEGWQYGFSSRKKCKMFVKTEKNQKIVGQGGSMQCSCHPRCYKNSPGT